MKFNKSFPIQLSLTLLCIAATEIQAQEIWSGNSVSFSKASFADPTDPANQDRMTSMTWITRGDSLGIYNIQLEAFHDKSSSPANTRWAYDLTGNGNTGLSITAANHAALSFETWQDSVNLQPRRAIDLPGVVHLIAEDIYVDIMFTDFEGSSTTGGGGSFAYLRGGPPALQSIRQGGSNPLSLTSTNAVLGSSISFDVDLSTTGHTMSLLFLYTSPDLQICPAGQAVLIGGGYIAGLGMRTGPVANYSFMMPNDTALVGLTISAQAVHVMGVLPFAMSNAIDLTAGY